MHLLVNPPGGAAAVPLPQALPRIPPTGRRSRRERCPLRIGFPERRRRSGTAQSRRCILRRRSPAGRDGDCARLPRRRPCVLRRPQRLQRGNDVRVHRPGSRSRHRRDVRRRDLSDGTPIAPAAAWWRRDRSSAGARNRGRPCRDDVHVRPEQQSAAVPRDVRRATVTASSATCRSPRRDPARRRAAASRRRRAPGLVDVYRSRNAAQVRGLFVPQGRVIALSGDTGISAYNHLHTQVLRPIEQHRLWLDPPVQLLRCAPRHQARPARGTPRERRAAVVHLLRFRQYADRADMSAPGRPQSAKSAPGTWA